MRNAKMCVASGLVSLWAAGAVTAAVINVDLGNPFAGQPTYVGLGAAPDESGGTTWNGIFSGEAGNEALVDSQGGATSVVLNTVGPQFPFINTTGAQVSGGSHAAFALLADYSAVFGVGTLKLSGLDPAATYTLYLYGGGDNEGNSTSFTVNGVTLSTTGVAAATTVLTAGEDYVVFSGLTPDANNELVATWGAGPNTGAGAFYGLQLIGETPLVVPAPGVLAGFVMLAGGLMRRRV